MRSAVLSSVLCVLAGAAAAEDRFTAEQLRARYYYDLGAAEIDVSGYPAKQKAAYETFRRVCSQCHTPARAINSPLTTTADWRRFIERMKKRTKVHAGTDVPQDVVDVLVDFLAYDSKARKVDGKAAFDAETRRLRELFEAVVAERRRRGISEDEKKIKPLPQDAGAGVRPRP